MTTFRILASTALALTLAQQASAQDRVEPPILTWSNFGTPGLVDLPTALSAEDGTIAVTANYGAGTLQSTLTFQITERLSGSFRYTRIEDWYDDDRDNSSYTDRSFDFRYQFLDEGRYTPAMAVGLQDFLGTGVYSGEYVVATKHLGSRVQVTGGLAWGRLAREDGFTNPLGVFNSSLETRDPLDLGEDVGGQFDSEDWFRGDAVFFGGVAVQATDRAVLKFEYSPDPQTREESIGNIDVQSPINVGLDYRLTDNIAAGLWYRHGDQIGVMLNTSLNPLQAPSAGGNHGAPAPVARRGNAPRDGGWVNNRAYLEQLRGQLTDVLAADGIRLQATRFEANEVELRIFNSRYEYEAEAIGRTARVMSQLLPASVERFVIVPVSNGTPISRVTLSRSDLERLEFDVDGSEQLLARAVIEDAASPRTQAESVPGLYPRFSWNLRPSFSVSSESRTEGRGSPRLHAELSARADLRPGLAVSGNIRQFVLGDDNFDTDPSDTALEPVRSNGSIYEAETGPTITDLTLAYQFRAAPNTFARVQGGLLESMFGGVAGEVLYAPVASRVAFGAEMAWVKQRDFDQLFTFQDYETVTGHASAYVKMTDQFLLQVDAGRYLAGDWGSTVSLSRNFANGWEVGAFATFTDVSFDDFGEGSFDKGITVQVPFAYFLGQPTRRTQNLTLRPVTRDGGARLDLEDRLYGQVTDYQYGSLEQSWGRVWR